MPREVAPKVSGAVQLTLAQARALQLAEMGLAPARWIGDYFRHAGKAARPHPDSLVETGELLRVEVADWPWSAYVHPDHATLLTAVQKNRLRPTYCTLLSPFDPLVWDRERALRMFNFDYRIECYTPEPKRKYGYFTLPILVRGELVARVDAKAHRADKIFAVRALHLELGVALTESLANDIAGALHRCAARHQTPTVQVLRTAPAKFLPPLRKALVAC